MTICMLSQGSHYASFLREHKSLRFYANPTYYSYSTHKYVQSVLATLIIPAAVNGLKASTNVPCPKDLERHGKPRNQIIASTSAFALGWVLGSYNMVVGDRFLGHTVVTMLLSWLVVLVLEKSQIKSLKRQTMQLNNQIMCRGHQIVLLLNPTKEFHG
jgi:membrane-associated PAP2 superfamily phosphatase